MAAIAIDYQKLASRQVVKVDRATGGESDPATLLELFRAAPEAVATLWAGVRLHSLHTMQFTIQKKMRACTHRSLLRVYNFSWSLDKSTYSVSSLTQTFQCSKIASSIQIQHQYHL